MVRRARARWVADSIYRGILHEKGVSGVAPVDPYEPPADREPRPSDILVDGYSYADMVDCNADSVIAVVKTRPLQITLHGRTITIPDVWIARARLELEVCPACVGSSRDVRRGCDHGGVREVAA